MWLLFCLWSSGEIWQFAGEEKPIFSLGGRHDNFWLVRKGDGALPSLWHVVAGKASRISLPEDSIYLAVHPDSNELMVVMPGHVAAYRAAESDLVETRRFGSSSQAYARRGPPLYGQVVSLKGFPYLVFFSNGRCHAVALTESGLAFQEPVSVISSIAVENSLMDPLVQSSRQELMWMAEEGLRVWSPFKEAPVDTVPFPTLRSMEKAVALPVSSGSPAWLVYGGLRGELSGFGWKVGEASATATGTGILARFGTDTSGDLARLFVLTVSNQVSSQLWSAVSGNTEFQCSLLIRRDGLWKLSNRLSFKLKKSKSKPRKAFGVSWTTDYNTDGYGDLVIADQKHGVRTFLSNSTGALTTKPVTLNRATEALINLPNALLVCRSQAEHWTVEVLVK